MAEPILKVENLEAGYGEVQVLWGISLGVEAGQLTTIIGANGAGKTTTLRASMGIINPKAGRIILKGEDVTRLPPHAKADRGMVLVPEGRQLFANMTVEENLEMGAYTPRVRANDPEESRLCLWSLSAAEGAPYAEGGHVLRRRAADACRCPRAYGGAGSPDY